MPLSLDSTLSVNLSCLLEYNSHTYHVWNLDYKLDKADNFTLVHCVMFYIFTWFSLTGEETVKQVVRF